MVKPLTYLILVFAFQPLISQYNPRCNPPTGLKSATRIWKTKDRKGKTKKHKSIIYFDRKGKPDSIISTINHSHTHFVYRGDSVIYVVSNRLLNRRVIDGIAIDSIYKKPIRFIDTAFVLSRDSIGRPLIIKENDSTFYRKKYLSCATIIGYLIQNNDTLQSVTYHYEDRCLIKTIFDPKSIHQSIVLEKYFDYKLNKKGDWKRRKYQNENGPIIVERRKLKYY